MTGLQIGLGLAVAATAGPVIGPRSATEDPIALRGSVMMVPLTAQQHGDGVVVSIRNNDVSLRSLFTR